MATFSLFSSSESTKQTPKEPAAGMRIDATPLPGEPPLEVKARLAHLFRASTRQGLINPLSYVLAHYHARERK